jgi:hypothetical protein
MIRPANHPNFHIGIFDGFTLLNKNFKEIFDSQSESFNKVNLNRWLIISIIYFDINRRFSFISWQIWQTLWVSCAINWG